MPTGLKRGERRTRADLDLIRRVKARREAMELSLRGLAQQSGFYGASMLSTLERSLRPDGPRVRMSGRGRRSLEEWLAATEPATESAG